MTDSEILELARRAGVDQLRAGSESTLLAFARLVAEAERERRIEICDARALREQKAKEWLRSGGAVSCGNDIAAASTIRSRTE